MQFKECDFLSEKITRLFIGSEILKSIQKFNGCLIRPETMDAIDREIIQTIRFLRHTRIIPDEWRDPVFGLAQKDNELSLVAMNDMSKEILDEVEQYARQP